MANDGRDLQRLVRNIESAKASGRKDLKIESPAYLLDKLTGQKREHDVLLTYNLNHHEVLMALECRDRSRPIGIDAVEAFRSKCESTGVHRGVMVSSKGFTKPAIAKAIIYNIACLTLDDAERFDWCVAPGIEVKARHILHTHISINFADGTDKSGVIVDEAGENFLPEVAKRWASNILTSHSDMVPFDGGQHQVPFYMVDPPLFMLINNERTQAKEVTFTITFEVRSDLAPFTFRHYSDASNATDITDAAVASIPIGGDKTADVVLSRGEDGITITLVPNKK